MSIVFIHATVTLDGFLADADGGVDWMFDFPSAPQDEDVVNRVCERIGAVVGGANRTQTIEDDERPYGGMIKAPVLLMTHRPAEPVVRDGVRYTFVVDDIAAAVRAAKEAAGDKWVSLLGGKVSRQCLQLGLVDEIEHRVARSGLRPVDDAGDLVAVDEDVADLQVAVDERRPPRAQRRLGDLAVAVDHLGRQDTVVEQPRALAGELRRDVVEVAARPARHRCIVQPPYGGADRGPRCGRRARRLTENAERLAAHCFDGEHRRPAPEDRRRRHRRHGHRPDLDVGVGGLRVDLQEHLTDPQRRPLTVCDDDLDLFHTGHPGSVRRRRGSRPTGGCADAAGRGIRSAHRRVP